MLASGTYHKDGLGVGLAVVVYTGEVIVVPLHVRVFVSTTGKGESAGKLASLCSDPLHRV